MSGLGTRLTRRAVLAAAGAAVIAAPRAAWSQPTAPRIDGTRLRRRLEQLSTFGRPSGGTFASGVGIWSSSPPLDPLQAARQRPIKSTRRVETTIDNSRRRAA